jgi:hypothetical protein
LFRLKRASRDCPITDGPFDVYAKGGEEGGKMDGWMEIERLKGRSWGRCLPRGWHKGGAHRRIYIHFQVILEI